jgi:hypothetical protein
MHKTLDPAALSEQERQRLFSALIKVYSERAGERWARGMRSLPPPYAGGAWGVTASEVALAAGEMLREAGVTAFELARLDY